MKNKERNIVEWNLKGNKNVVSSSNYIDNIWNKHSLEKTARISRKLKK